MVTQTTVESVFGYLGHDGSEILWPDLPEPLKRRAFHIEEMQYAAYHYGWCLVPYYLGVNYCPLPDSKVAEYDFRDKFKLALRNYDGILLGNYVGRSNQHAVAWNAKEQRIYDPSNHYAPLEAFDPESFHAARRA